MFDFQLLRLDEVAQCVALSPGHIRRLIRLEQFPPPSHHFGTRAARWTAADIEKWLRAKRK